MRNRVSQGLGCGTDRTKILNCSSEYFLVFHNHNPALSWQVGPRERIVRLLIGVEANRMDPNSQLSFVPLDLLNSLTFHATYGRVKQEHMIFCLSLNSPSMLPTFWGVRIPVTYLPFSAVGKYNSVEFR